jgi:hypothetical protein
MRLAVWVVCLISSVGCGHGLPRLRSVRACFCCCPLFDGDWASDAKDGGLGSFTFMVDAAVRRSTSGVHLSDSQGFVQVTSKVECRVASLAST